MKLVRSVLSESQRNTRRPKAGGTQLNELMYKGIKPQCTPPAVAAAEVLHEVNVWERAEGTLLQ
jgi:hypothetical protein